MDLSFSKLRVTAKLKSDRKISEAVQTIPRHVLENRQNRVFGTNRCTNIPSKMIARTDQSSTDGSKLHTNHGKSKPTAASSPSTAAGSHDDTTLPTSEAEKKLVFLERTAGQTKEKKKRGIGLIPKEKAGIKAPNNPDQNQMDVLLPRPPPAKTPDPPVLHHSSPSSSTRMAGSRADQRHEVTPYHSAQNCSKCRFDKLETSSYWLGQIRLAESVGKHFVSASFFNLASECKAEPIRSLRIELKKYLKRHEHLKLQAEWMGISLIYGLIMEGSEEEMQLPPPPLTTCNKTALEKEEEKKTHLVTRQFLPL